MMEFPYPILEELLRVLMLKVVIVNYPGAGISPPPSAPITLLWLAIRSLG